MPNTRATERRNAKAVQKGDQKNCGGRGITGTTHPSGKNPREESLNAEEKEERKKKGQEGKEQQVLQG